MSIRLTLHALLIVACFASSELAQAEVKEYIRDYNYQGEPYDTVASCRVNAVNGVKRELLEELGTYIGSVVKQHQDSLGNSYMSHDVINITAGIVALKVLDEKWKQPVYYVKAGMKADPDDVLTKLKAMRADLELEKNLRESYEELERARNEVAQLKAQLAQLRLAGALPAVNAEVAPPIPVKPAPVPVVKQLQAKEETAQKNLAKDMKEQNAVPPAVPVPLASSPEVAVPILIPVPAVTTPAPAPAPAIGSEAEQASASAQKAHAELARDAEAFKAAQPVPEPVKVATAPSEAAKVIAQYVKSVQDVEVGEAFQRAMAARMNGDFDAMVKEVRPLAEKGYAKAELQMGWIYERGLGVPQDYQQARDWYLKAVASGDIDANAQIGWLYERGLGVEKSYEKAAEYYGRALNEGSAWGYARMGYLYETGKGVKLNWTQAADYYRLGMEKGNFNAMARLGFLYQQGNGVLRDEHKAAELYKQAVEHGDPLAMTRLGQMHNLGHGGVSLDHAKALALLRESVRYKVPAAYAFMGFMFENGWEVKQDYDAAKQWYEKAAELDAPFAEFRLGVMYKEGNGVAEDRQKAEYWLERAAGKGNEKAGAVLSRMRNGMKR